MCEARDGNAMSIGVKSVDRTEAPCDKVTQEQPESQGADDSQANAKADDAEVVREEIPENELYKSKTIAQKLFVVSAGVIMNIVFAIFLVIFCASVFHKLPTILAGCIYIANHEETIKDLSLDELIVLSRFSIVEPPGFYEGAVDYLGKDLLTAVTKKHFDYTYQSAFLDYAESRIREGHTKEGTAAYIRDVPLEQLKEETFEYERKLLEEVGHYL